MAHSDDTRRKVRAAYIFDQMDLPVAALKEGVPDGTAKRWKKEAKAAGDDWDRARSAQLIAGGGMEEQVVQGRVGQHQAQPLQAGGDAGQLGVGVVLLAQQDDAALGQFQQARLVAAQGAEGIGRGHVGGHHGEGLFLPLLAAVGVDNDLVDAGDQLLDQREIQTQLHQTCPTSLSTASAACCEASWRNARGSSCHSAITPSLPALAARSANSGG